MRPHLLFQVNYQQASHSAFTTNTTTIDHINTPTMLLRNLLLSLGISNLIAATPVCTNSSGILPTIDLGYAVYRASSYSVLIPPFSVDGSAFLYLELLSSHTKSIRKSTGGLRLLHFLQYPFRRTTYRCSPFRCSPTAIGG